jgi:hypothetical protein
LAIRIKAGAADKLRSRIQRQGSTGSILGLFIDFAQKFVYCLPNLIIFEHSADFSQRDSHFVVNKRGSMTDDLKF